MLKLSLFAALALTSTTVAAEPRDGSHDFDFQVGSWKLKIRRLEHPLSGQTKWIDYTGTGTARTIWNGKAQIEDLEIDSTTGVHVEGMTVRTYSPTSHQWQLSWANSKTGTFGVPSVGEFNGDHGEFYDQEEINGRMVLVKLTWTHITKTSAHFEQSFSDDGGKTWEPNWITDETRI